MGQAAFIPPPGFDDLTPEEQLEYAQRLLDRAADSVERAPVPSWHLEIVQERLREHQTDPSTAEDWSTVYERLREKFASKAE